MKKNKHENISRKEALKRISKYTKYAALTAAGTFLILHPKRAQAASIEPPGTGY